ncbi:DUF4911 domain-containing protein [bacterium]|nr:DUF4911 domain-containing protein [bacterium]
MNAMADVGGLEPIFLRVAPIDIALVKFIFESYEGVGIVRTLDRRAAVIVALISRDFLADARGIVADLQGRIGCEVIPPPPGAGDDWLLALMEDSSGE